MHRFYLEPEHCGGTVILLAGREAHHALHVLRVRRDEAVVVLDGCGSELHCEVGDCGRDRVSLHVKRRNSVSSLPCRITLLQAIPKGKIIESIIQKATELGASRIVPLLSERVTSQLDADGAAAKAEKWRQTAVEAIKQCGSAWLPAVETPVTPSVFLKRSESVDLSLLASLQPGSRHPRDLFNAFLSVHNRPPESIAVWVGPEGDFSPGEIDAITSSGAQPITLGPLTLRSETAAAYCLSVLSYEVHSPRA